ncbi:MAG TPA: thioredoxin [Micromonosporaceae bacterium]|jgi:thioredoxin 2
MTTAPNIIACPHCGKRNRVPAAAAGVPRCGNCHNPLPWITAADDESFADVVDAARLPVLVDLWATWCAPCRVVSPALEQVARDLAGTVKLVKVDVDAAPKTAARFAVQAIPTLLVMSGGDVKARRAGAVSAAVIRQWVTDTIGAGASGP